METNNYGERVWAKDITPEFTKNGDVTNLEAVNNALENLIMTASGERILNGIGSSVPLRLFGGINGILLDTIEDDILTVVKQHSVHIDRTTVDVRVEFNSSDNSIYIRILYTTNSGVNGEYYSSKELNNG